MNRRGKVAIISIVALLVVPTAAPAMLFFPYSAQSGGHQVYSETPIDQAALDLITKRSASLVQASPLARPSEPRQIFLTEGGWRWLWLTTRSRNAFAISQRVGEAIIFNRSDLASDRVRNGGAVGGERTVSGVLAHEICHGMLRRPFGFTVDLSKPQWLREGYCDHVAKESTYRSRSPSSIRGEKHARSLISKSASASPPSFAATAAMPIRCSPMPAKRPESAPARAGTRGRSSVLEAGAAVESGRAA